MLIVLLIQSNTIFPVTIISQIMVLLTNKLDTITYLHYLHQSSTHGNRIKITSGKLPHSEASKAKLDRSVLEEQKFYPLNTDQLLDRQVWH